jgi:hypothetical protein
VEAKGTFLNPLKRYGNYIFHLLHFAFTWLIRFCIRDYLLKPR